MKLKNKTAITSNTVFLLKISILWGLEGGKYCIYSASIYSAYNQDCVPTNQEIWEKKVYRRRDNVAFVKVGKPYIS